MINITSVKPGTNEVDKISGILDMLTSVDCRFVTMIYSSLLNIRLP
jgi:hypothetical protein